MLDYDREAARYDATRGGDARADAAADAIETLLPAAARGVARIADWRQRLAGDATEWIGAAGQERVDALCAELDRLPDQERARPDPVYQLAALRKR